MLKFHFCISLCVLILPYVISFEGTTYNPDELTDVSTLLFCDDAIRNYSFATRRVSTLVSHITRPRIVDYHFKKRLLFWTDYDGKINRAPLLQERVRPSVLPGLSGDYGLAVDWLHDLLYWTNYPNKTLEVARLDGTMMKTVIQEDGTEPAAVALNPSEGFMFWSDQGNVKKIERCNMDGTNRKVIIKEDISDVYSLAIDMDSRKIFWVDYGTNYLCSAKFDGNHRKNLFTQLKDPISVDVDGTYMYFNTIEKNHQAVYQVQQEDGSMVKWQQKIFDGDSTLRSVKVFDPNRQSGGFNVCGANNGGCSHLCLPASAHTFSCACPNTYTLSTSDNSTCLNSDGSIASTPSLATIPTTTHLPSAVFESYSTSSTVETVTKSIDLTTAPHSTHSTLAIVISILALIVVVGMLIYFRLLLLKYLGNAGITNPVSFSKNAEENVYCDV